MLKRLRNLSNQDNFIYQGYIEGNNIMSGISNVIVTDGFTGNVALKQQREQPNLLQII